MSSIGIRWFCFDKFRFHAHFHFGTIIFYFFSPLLWDFFKTSNKVSLTQASCAGGSNLTRFGDVGFFGLRFLSVCAFFFSWEITSVEQEHRFSLINTNEWNEQKGIDLFLSNENITQSPCFPPQTVVTWQREAAQAWAVCSVHACLPSLGWSKEGEWMRLTGEVTMKGGEKG